jgi:hypothetical protein
MLVLGRSGGGVVAGADLSFAQPGVEAIDEIEVQGPGPRVANDESNTSGRRQSVVVGNCVEIDSPLRW